MEYQIFLCIFQKNSAMATLGLKEMGKFLPEGREKGLPCWLSQFSKTGLDAMPLFLLDDLLNHRSRVFLYECRSKYMEIFKSRFSCS